MSYVGDDVRNFGRLAEVSKLCGIGRMFTVISSSVGKSMCSTHSPVSFSSVIFLRLGVEVID
jgi:hypothetical protein